MDDSRILIVGAGPTGLVLAIVLARHDIPFRIIDAASGPGQQSRAMAVHARTLEFYEQLGFADEVVANGLPAVEAHFRERNFFGISGDVGDLKIGEIGKGQSRFPFILTYPQDLHEKLLVQELSKLHVSVEYKTALNTLNQQEEKIIVDLDGPHGCEQATFGYVCGCDGAHSKVRHFSNINFPGGTYEQPFFVSDVELASNFSATDIYANISGQTLALLMPIRKTGMHRLTGLIPPGKAHLEKINFEDVRSDLEELIGTQVKKLNWFSEYHVHHRVAEHFRDRRVFLLGDAAHVHSPVGGQGMNTGIGDAVNLGWKLAGVISGRTHPNILDSYEPERKGFAEQLVRTTDTIFSFMISRGWLGSAFRRLVMPVVINLINSFDFTRRAAFRSMSQIAISYRDSTLSEGQVGALAGGDRLPWIEYGEDDNFAALKSFEWHLHTYGDGNSELLERISKGTGLPLYRFKWTPESKAAGIVQDALYLIRPDGHISFVMRPPNAEALNSYLKRIGLRLSCS
ncbi:hypothetical protein M433DRAFT_432345 [Acidomyces richmondensis BFW]|nr:hypothetical protein M433DRAFT_432345 [Acidomyces richmondensis BFW]